LVKSHITYVKKLITYVKNLITFGAGILEYVRQIGIEIHTGSHIVQEYEIVPVLLQLLVTMPELFFFIVIRSSKLERLRKIILSLPSELVLFWQKVPTLRIRKSIGASLARPIPDR
jgi:hypothetical protein